MHGGALFKLEFTERRCDLAEREPRDTRKFIDATLFARRQRVKYARCLRTELKVKVVPASI